MPEEKQTIPAKVHIFVLADEVLPSGKVVRRVLVLNEFNATAYQNAADVAARLMHPEIFGMRPPDMQSLISMGRHAQGMNNSRFLSASRLPGGSTRFEGRPVWIDVWKAKRAGVEIHDTPEILADLDRIIAKTTKPQNVLKLQNIKRLVRSDKEVLLEGRIPASAIKSASMMRMTRGLQVVECIGIVLSIYDLEEASRQSYSQHNIRPLEKEAIRQVGGWAGAWAGLQIGSAGGALIGIETGPGAILTAAAGGIIGGIAGFLGANWIAGKL